jgi:hypothetical protein
LTGIRQRYPVLYVAVGRRLGYPLKLVRAVRHLFARWDDPGGELFNIEISNAGGVDVHPDEYYRTWPYPIRDTGWQPGETSFLRSLSPREEVAHAWSKRGFCWQANVLMREAVDSFATACSIVTDDRGLDSCLGRSLREWRESLARRIPAKTPELRISFPAPRRYPGLPVEMERDILALGVVEDLLDGPVPDADRVECRIF